MAITNGTLAQSINDLIAYWDSFNEEYATWIGGEVGGGPNSDGDYPLTDFNGNVRLTACPAQLEYDVTGLVNSASSYATAAGDAQTAAEAAETNATTAQTNAEAAETAAAASEANALAAQTAAESARTTCIAQAATATAAAGTASSDAADAAADAAAAAASAAAAAASAASIDLGDYYTAAEVDALIAAIDEFDVTADYSPSGTWTFAQNKLVPSASFGIKGTSTGNANVAYMAFNESNGSTRQGYIGYGSGSNSILTINNERTDGQVRVLGHDGTTLRNMLILDPDATVGTTNGIYTRNNLSMTTRYYAESGLSTAGQIKHHRGTMFDIGMNVSPRVATNISFTWTATEAGCTAYYNSGAYTITLPSSSDIPTDAQMQVWSISTSNITIAPGAGASLYWVDNGVTTTGTRTLNRGMCTIWKYSTGVYFIVGTGLS